MKKTYTLFLLLLIIDPTYGAIGDTFIIDNIQYSVRQEGTNNLVHLVANQDLNRTMAYIPDSVTNPNSGITYRVYALRAAAFSNSSQLDSIRLPHMLDSINSDAFSYCSKLKSIVIPASVQSITVGAFYAMDSLAQIVVDTNNQNYTSIDGVLFNKNGKILHSYPNMKDSVYIMPAGVEIIEDIAFEERNYIKEIVFPSSLRIINTGAFSGAANLTTINLEQTSVEDIGPFAFNYCYSLHEVIFPSTINFIGTEAFDECRALIRADFSNVNDSINIQHLVFRSCESLISVDIPPHLLLIDMGVFLDCKSLTSVDFSRAISMSGISYQAFEGCSSLPILDLSQATNFMVINSSAFRDNSSLTHVIFPREFGDVAAGLYFYHIYSGAFENCSSLISIVNPQPVPQKVQPGAFNGVDKVACDVFVADSVLLDYIAAPVWCDFFYSNLVVQPNNSSHGSTQGGGVFAFFEQDTLVATAKPGCAFVYWTNKEDSILSYSDTLIYTMMYNDSVTAHFRDLSDGDATLLTIVPSAGTLSPLFNAQQFYYTDTVRYAVDSIRYSVVTNSLGAVVNGNDTLMRALAVGHNVHSITVTSRDGYLTETYYIDVYRLNNNAYLHDLQLTNYSLTPAFDSLTYQYRVQVTPEVTQVTLTPTLSDVHALLQGNYGTQPLAEGNNRFDMLVYAEDRDTMRTYTLEVFRESYPPGREANLIQVSVNGNELLTAATSGLNSSYSGACGEGEFTIALTLSEFATTDIENPLVVTIDALAGLDTILFTVTSGSGLVTTQHRLILEKRFEFDDVVETLWRDNTFMLDIRMLNEHGIAVRYESEYQWYKNGAPIAGGSYPTLSAGGAATDHFEYHVPYYLEMHTDGGEVLRTCEKILTPSAKTSSVYPNPVAANHPFTLSLERAEGVIEVYAIHGVCVLQQSVSDSIVQLSLPEKGVYVVKHSVEGKVLNIYKVVVN